MTLVDFAIVVKGMRDAQRKYFRSRSSADLETSKLTEKAIDRLVDDVLKGPGLFGTEDAEPATKGDRAR